MFGCFSFFYFFCNVLSIVQGCKDASVRCSCCGFGVFLFFVCFAFHFTFWGTAGWFVQYIGIEIGCILCGLFQNFMVNMLVIDIVIYLF